MIIVTKNLKEKDHIGWSKIVICFITAFFVGTVVGFIYTSNYDGIIFLNDINLLNYLHDCRSDSEFFTDKDYITFDSIKLDDNHLWKDIPCSSHNESLITNHCCYELANMNKPMYN